MRKVIALVVILFAGCTLQDGFGAKVAAGCQTEDACRALLDEARARQGRCRPNTIGYVDCHEAEADVERALGLLNEQRQRAAREQDARAARELADRQSERDAARQEKELEEARAKRARQKEEDDAWSTLDLKKCALTADKEACFDVESFTARYPTNAHVGEARVALTTAERTRREQEEAKQSEAAKTEPTWTPPPTPTRQPPAAQPESTSSAGGLLCNDGTLSPSCTCGGSHRGCCSHHGGVAGCQ